MNYYQNKSLFKNVITNTPYRISLGGGGTDLPFYFKEKGGFLISAGINQYLTIHLAERILDDKIFLQYSETEWKDNVEDLNHRLIKNILKYYDLTKGIQVSTISSMPIYTGLGASSSLTVGLVNAINKLKGLNLSAIEVAEISFHIERNIAKLDGGYQDQYIASLGGIQVIEISENAKISCRRLKISSKNLEKIKSGLVLIHSRVNRQSERIIKSQHSSKTMMKCYDRIKEIGIMSENLLLNGNIVDFGLAMDEHWSVKKQISNLISNSYLDDIYIKLKNAGANGGKIIGAGGGGFFLMAVPENLEGFNNELKKLDLRAITFDFDTLGSHVMHTLGH